MSESTGSNDGESAAGEDVVDMEIHKPKAAHSWREFLVEIGTIICGILIALGLEQAVEAGHHRKEINEARRALDAEIAFNLAGDDSITAQASCANNRLDELSRWRGSLAGGHPLRFTGPVLGPLRLVHRTSVWKVASGEALSQMPFESRVAYARVYDLTDLVEEQEKDLATMWRELSQLALAPRLDDGQSLQAQFDIERLRRGYSVLVRNLADLRRDAVDVGVTKAASDALSDDIRTAARAFCEPLLAPS